MISFRHTIGAIALLFAAAFLALSCAQRSYRYTMRTQSFVKDLPLETVVQTAHTYWILSVEFSPDGEFLVTGSADNTAKLWNWQYGEQIRTFAGHTSSVESATFSPNGRLLATGSWDNTAKLWDVETGDALRTFSGHSDKVTAVRFSPDGRYLATGSADSSVILWNRRSGRKLFTFSGHAAKVTSLSFNPRGEILASGSWDQTVKFWNLQTGEEIRTLTGHTAGVQAVAFGPRGKLLASAGRDSTARVWEVDNGKERQVLSGHSASVEAVCFGKNGKLLVTGSHDFTAKLWQIEKGELLRTYEGHSSLVKSVDFGPDGQTIVTGSYDNTAKLWSVEDTETLGTLSGRSFPIEALDFSPDGTFLVTGTDDNTVKLWDLQIGKQIRTFLGHTAPVFAVGFSPDGRLLAGGGTDGTTIVWERGTGDTLQIFPGGYAGIQSVTFSPEGRYFATGTWDDTIKVYDLQSGARLHTLFGAASGGISALQFSPDGTLLAAGSGDHSATVWKVKSGELLHTLTGHTDNITALAFTRDRQLLVTGSYDKTVRFWDLATGAIRRRLEGHPARILSLVFSPGDTLLATAGDDNIARLWDARSGELRHTLYGHSNWILAGHFSPDSRFFLTGSQDATTKLWDVSSGKELATLVSLGLAGWAVTSPDGFFDVSPDAETNIHFVKGLESLEFEQLKERYYEPGLLAKIMEFSDEPLRDVKELQEVALYPEVEATVTDDEDSRLRIKLKNRGGGIGKVTVAINGKEIAADARKADANPRARDLTVNLDIAGHSFLIPGEENSVTVKAYNSQGYLSSRGLEVVYTPPPAEIPPTTLWGVAVGVSDYRGTQIDLRFAGKDALDMANALQIGGGNLFPDRTHIILFSSEKNDTLNPIYPSKRNFLDSLRAIAKRARSTDILVLYLAGHGITFGGQEGDYYFLLADARSGDLSDPAIRDKVAISSRELTEEIKKIPALKQVLILDTCHSGRFTELLTEQRAISSSQIRAYERMKDRTGTHVLAGAAADAVAYEASSYGQGLLTYSLLLGMQSEGLREEEFVDVSRLFEFSADRVPELARDIGGIQKPIVTTPVGGSSFDIGQLQGPDKSRIPLAEVRPLVIRANFQNEDPPFLDHLNLTRLVNDRMRTLSARGRAAPLIFVDVPQFPRAYKILGRYQQNDDSLTVTVYLVRSTETVRQFTVEGAVSELEALVQDILAKTERQLNL